MTCSLRCWISIKLGAQVGVVGQQVGGLVHQLLGHGRVFSRCRVDAFGEVVGVLEPRAAARAAPTWSGSMASSSVLAMSCTAQAAGQRGDVVVVLRRQLASPAWPGVRPATKGVGVIRAQGQAVEQLVEGHACVCVPASWCRTWGSRSRPRHRQSRSGPCCRRRLVTMLRSLALMTRVPRPSICS